MVFQQFILLAILEQGIKSQLSSMTLNFFLEIYIYINSYVLHCEYNARLMNVQEFHFEKDT